MDLIRSEDKLADKFVTSFREDGYNKDKVKFNGSS
jgi:hypothetical protein